MSNDFSKATPRLWKYFWNGVCWQIDDDQHAIATTQFCYAEDAETNARLIVAAVNEHDALKAEQTAYKWAMGEAKKMFDAAVAERDALRQALEEARQALNTINVVSSPNPERTMVPGASQDLGWCCDESRRALARIDAILKAKCKGNC